MFVHKHPILLTDTADIVLTNLIRDAEAQGEEKAVMRLGQRQSLFRRSREIGIDAAFTEAQARKLTELLPGVSVEEIERSLLTQFPAEQLNTIRDLLSEPLLM